VYLTPGERVVASILYRSLRAGAEAIRRGIRDVGTVQAAMSKLLRQEPGVRVDYLAVCDAETLEPLTSITSRAVLLGAIRIGSVRLIDNIVVALPAKRGS
ncbi:MAG TPA: pantoate--beta-alanine ligase, partial [Terriglobales bacterium]|nr:pantoate--beta-alanine ligase [Terriglobales bacterium]